ncbi:MAG: hypothetical protein IJ061_00610 [Lachnospiraceae bacterium]|nr:hypothetical protein [Lachnospiraceae bacterium]
MTVDEENQGISCLLHRQKYLDEHHKTFNPCIFKKPDFCKTLEFVEQSKIKDKTQFTLSPHFPTYSNISQHFSTYPNISQHIPTFLIKGKRKTFTNPATRV